MSVCTTEDICKLRLQGKTFQEIGDMYGVSRQAIHQKLNAKYSGKWVDGTDLRELRRLCGVTIKEAAKWTGLSETSMGFIERGKVKIKDHKYLMLVDYYQNSFINNYYKMCDILEKINNFCN